MKNTNCIKPLVQKLVNRFGYEIHRKPAYDLGPYYRLYSKESVEQRRFYNIGSGLFSHKAWMNIDHASEWYESNVIDIDFDLLQLGKLPIEDNTAEVVYSSHTIEHITNAAGQVGYALDFDGVNDYIRQSNPTFIDDSQGTIEFEVKISNLTKQTHLVGVCVNGTTDDEYHLWFRGDSVKELQVTYILNGGVPWLANTAANTINDSNWHYITLKSDGSTVKLFVDGVQKTLTNVLGTNSGQWLASATQANVFCVGALLRVSPILPLGGYGDEVRYSDDDRTDAWIKASYETERDNLLIWGSEETSAIPDITNTPDNYGFGVVAVGASTNTIINCFTLNNTGNCAVDVTIQGTNLTGGDDTWALSGTATPGENIYGLYAGLDDGDDAYDVVVNATANAFISGLTENATQGWGLKLYMPASLSGYDNNEMTTIITLIASAS